jgi:hypothetical protein
MLRFMSSKAAYGPRAASWPPLIYIIVDYRTIANIVVIMIITVIVHNLSCNLISILVLIISYVWFILFSDLLFCGDKDLFHWLWWWKEWFAPSDEKFEPIIKDRDSDCICDPWLRSSFDSLFDESFVKNIFQI